MHFLVSSEKISMKYLLKCVMISLCIAKYSIPEWEMHQLTFLNKDSTMRMLRFREHERYTDP